MSLEEHAQRNVIKKPAAAVGGGGASVEEGVASVLEGGASDGEGSDEEADALVERMLKEVSLEKQLGQDGKIGGGDQDSDSLLGSSGGNTPKVSG